MDYRKFLDKSEYQDAWEEFSYFNDYKTFIDFYKMTAVTYIM